MTYILRIIGITIIALYVYFRFIITRMPRNLSFYIMENDITITYNYTIMCISLFGLMTSGIMIFLSKKKIEKKSIEISSNIMKKFLVMTNMVVCYIKYILQILKVWCAQQVPDSYNKLYTICNIFYKRFGYYEKQICIILVMIPHLIVVSCFYIDTLCFFQIRYFYKSITILIVPLIYHLFLYLMTDIISNLNIIEETLNVEHSVLSNGKDRFTFNLKSESVISNSTFEFYVSEYLKLIPLKGFLTSYFNIENYYKPRLFLFIYIGYFIGWVYIIIMNLITIHTLYPFTGN